MAKETPDAIIDLMLDQAQGTHVTVCSAQPANYADIAAVALAGQTISGSHTKANGDVSGRKNTTPAQTAVPISATGTANHVVEHNNTDTIFKITTCPAQALTNGGTVDLSAYAHEITDAS